MEKALDSLLELVTNEEKLRSFVMTDPNQPDNPIVFVNDAFCKLTGYVREQAIGRNCRFLQGPDTSRDAIASLKQAIAQRVPVEVTLLNYTADGSQFWNHLRIRPIFGPGGRLDNFVGVQTCVTGPADAQA